MLRCIIGMVGISNYATRYNSHLVCVSLLAACLICAGCTKSQDSHVLTDEELLELEFFETDGIVEFGDLPKIRSAESFLKTDVLPHLEGPIVAGRNYLYCGTFKLAWDAMGNAASISDVEMGEAIDRLEFSSSDLDSESYLALTGNRDEILAGMDEKFPDANIELPDSIDSGGKHSFVYLQKHLPFREKFRRLETPLSFQSAAGQFSAGNFGVESFFEGSTRDTVHRMQISIIDYKSKNDFVLRLNTMSERDQMILAKVSPGTTLGECLSSVQDRVSNGYPEGDEKVSIQAGETMVVPIISIGVLRRYDELTAKEVSPEQADLQAAYQVIQFRLDESGAKLKSIGGYSSLGEDGGPRRFIFDSPFLLYLVQKDSQNPYLVAWIENEELMELALPQE